MNYLLIKILLIGFFGLMISRSFCQIKYFKADKDTISRFDSTTLRWQVLGTDSILITGIGMVKSTDEKTISLEFSKEFTIIIESDSNILYKSVKITVQGKKGNGDFPDRKQFSYQNTLQLATANLSIDLLINKLIMALENYGFKTITYNNISTDGNIEIATNFSVSSDLINSSSSQKRNVAFLIEIKKFEIINNTLDFGHIDFKIPQILVCIIKPLIQYNLLGEPSKLNILDYPRNQSLYVQVAVNLKNIINKLADLSPKK